MKLLTSQKDTLFTLIENAGLSPSQFEFSEIRSVISLNQIATKLIYKKSNYYFLFETGPGSSTTHYAIFYPGSNAYEETVFPGSWDLQLKKVNRWLSNIVREINTPNKWDRLYKEIESIGIKFENDDDKFSIHEFEDLGKKINTLKQGILSIGLQSEQVSAINYKLDHLSELAKNMSKFDWKGLFIGTIISIVIQLSVSPDNAKLLWNMIKQVFNNFLLP